MDFGSLIRALYYNHHIPFRFRLEWGKVKELIRSSLPLYASAVSWFFSGQGDRVVTVYLLGTYELGLYQFIALIATIPTFLLNSIANALVSSLSYHTTKGRDLTSMGSLFLRTIMPLSVIIAILGYGLSPFIIHYLFPAYVEGIEPLQLLFLTTMSLIPFQFLPSITVVARKSYMLFFLLGVGIAMEIVLFSFMLIPKMGILGAALSQIVSNMTFSALITIISVKQRTFTLGKKEALAFSLLLIAPLSLVSWIISLLLVIVVTKLAGIIEEEEITLINALLPERLSPLARLIRVMFQS
ncbi:oligosaccharide flippase family protein [Sulfuracidifex tepidarius]|uniref:oligosaccharide flippase family protein n=1 Tax=Sulfuracidifex tepidarius TaxID=1294262 RepID=UPI0012E20928